MKVITRLSFIFDPEELWQSQKAFDADLASFFIDRGIKAEFITGAELDDDDRMLYLCKHESHEDMAEKVASPTKQKAQMKFTMARNKLNSERNNG